MNVVLQEIKRIFRPLTVAVLLLFTALYSYAFIGLALGQFTTLHMPCDAVNASKDIIALAGSAVEADEADKVLRALTDRYIKEIDAAIAKEPRFAAAGVRNFGDYQNLRKKIDFSHVSPEDIVMIEGNELEESTVYVGETRVSGDDSGYDPDKDYTLTPEEQYIEEHDFFGSMVGHISEKLRYITYDDDAGALDMLGKRFDEWNSFSGDDFEEMARSDFEAARLQEIVATGEMRNVMPYPIHESVNLLVRTLPIMIIVTLCFLFAPVLTRDNMQRLVYLQYTSRTGRKTLNRQLLSMLITAFLITALEIGVTAVVFFAKGWGAFLGVKLNSVLAFGQFYFMGTFGKYLLCIAGIIFLLAFSCTFMVFFISKISKNYINLLLCLLPWIAFTVFVVWKISEGVFAINWSDGSLYGFTIIPYIEIYLCVALFLIGAVFTFVAVKKNRTADIV